MFKQTTLKIVFLSVSYSIMNLVGIANDKQMWYINMEKYQL